jgi:hypothetical protein
MHENPNHDLMCTFSCQSPVQPIMGSEVHLTGVNVGLLGYSAMWTCTYIPMFLQDQHKHIHCYNNLKSDIRYLTSAYIV